MIDFCVQRQGKTKSGEPTDWLYSILAFDGNECLIWPFARTKAGYGNIGWGDGNAYPHRIICEAINGPPPTPEHQASHTCGRGKNGCVNPRHLEWATPLQNSQHTATLGKTTRGRNNKLDVSEVIQIRALLGKKKQDEIALDFGVCQATISAIAMKKIWEWLD